MSYVKYEAELKKVTIKGDGKCDIVLEASNLTGALETLSRMTKTKIEVTHENRVVHYQVDIHPETKEDIKHYRVDASGVVEEVKTEGEQLEMELDGVEEKITPEQDKRELDKEVVDDFIASGLAPAYEDLDIYFPVYIERLRGGETYLKFANELGLSSGRVAEMFDEYRKRVAPLAVKWNEWRKSQPAVETKEANEQAENTKPVQEQQQAKEISQEDLEAFILSNKPSFEDIELDFPALLEKRKNGSTWMEIAREQNMTSGQLQVLWSKYKQKVKVLMSTEEA